MQEAVNSPPPLRGTIILDSSAIMNMCTEIPKELRSESALGSHRYLDVLPFLARNGFDLVIPEIVSLESGDVFKDGTDIGRFFPRGGHYTADKKIKPFLKAVARGDFPGIHIEDSGGPEKVTAYVQGLRDAYAAASALRPGGRGDHRNFVKGAARTAVLLSRGQTDKTDFGDDAIVHMTETRYLPASHEEPVFVMTSDGRLKSRLKADVLPVSSRSLIYSMAEAGLNEEMGARATATGPELWEAARKTLGLKSHGSVNAEDYTALIRKRSFFKSLEAIAGELKAQGAEEPAAAAQSADPHSRINRFKAKYASANGTPGDTQQR